MNEILKAIIDGAVSASLLEQLGTILGIVGVWLMIRQNLWAFPVGLLQVAIFGYVCFFGGLYSETVLQVIFFVSLAYGWWHWTHAGDGGRKELPVRRLSVMAGLAWSAATLLVWGVWGTIMSRLPNVALPYADGFVFAVSVTSQWLQARKVLANWTGWLIANGVGVGVFWFKGYYWFAVLYGVFWFMALDGLSAWRTSWKKEQGHA